ncbi:MAG: glycosyltransferase family 87 protein [Tepidisphaeraceae bacterium]
MNPALLDRFPYESPALPEKWRWARSAAYIAIACLFLALIYQFHRGTMKNLRRAAEAREAGITEGVKQHKGAIGRWRLDIQQFWKGQNIYLGPLPPGQEHPRPNDAWQAKHPNMPVVVVLLTPFGSMPAPIAALVWNVLKLVALAGTVLMTVAVVNHDGRRMPDWVVLLGFLAGANFIVADFQHANTNVFVAAAIVGHCYAYRQGRDVLAGALLALAIALKMTPALFVLYWVWQREWRVLASTFVALAALVLSPALFTGWSFYAECMTTWWTQTVGPGLSGAQWYPASINQSLPGMIARYFLGGDNGNFLWEPDDEPVPTKFGWITVIELSPVAAKRLLQALQAIIVIVSFWAIGLRKLPRDDGRRGLHYGLVLSMMMLLNQRTWEHHAAPLIIAFVAIVYAACYAIATRRWRRGIGYTLLAAVILPLVSGDDPMKLLFGEAGSDRAAAYGTTFWSFLATWILCAIAARKLRDVPEPYVDPAAKAASPSMNEVVATMR